MLEGEDLVQVIEEKPRFVVERRQTMGASVRAVVCDTEDCTFWRRLADFERNQAEQDRLLEKLDRHSEEHDERGE